MYRATSSLEVYQPSSVTVALPPSLGDDARDLVGRAFDAAASLYGEVTEVTRPWR